MMQGMGFRGRGRGRGGFDYPATGAPAAGGSGRETDTLHVRITELRQPVSEDMMQKVFGSVSLTPRRMHFMPFENASETVLVVQFADSFSASRAMEQLNHRNIFTDGNKMTMSYANWDSFVPGQQAVLMGGAAQQVGQNYGRAPMQIPYGMPPPQMVPALGNPSPTVYVGNPPATYPPATMQPMYSTQPYNPYAQPAPQPLQSGRGGMSVTVGVPPTGVTVAPGVAPGLAPGMNPGVTPTVGIGMPVGVGVPGAMVVGMNRGRGVGMGMNVGVGMGMGLGMGVGVPVNVGVGVGMQPAMRGGRGMGSTAFNPMVVGAMPYGYSPLGTPQVAGRQNNQLMPTVFLSVTVVPETEPLINVFVFLEAYGGVVTIRRNHNKKDILTVKMASVAEADNVVQNVRRAPFAGGTISAKRFPTYVERTPCTDDGNPNDPATLQYDFTTARHRSPAQRSKAPPSSLLKITGCADYSEGDIMAYFTGKSFFPERIVKEEDGSFTVHATDAETTVKILVSCHGNICGEEKSNVIFIEGPKPETEETTAANASPAAATAAPASPQVVVSVGAAPAATPAAAPAAEAAPPLSANEA